MNIIRFSVQTSFWAKNHVHLSRLLIVIGFILLTLIAVLTGQLLFMQEVLIPINVFWVALFIYVFTLSFYPGKKVSLREVNGLGQYVKRKGCDLLLAGTTFLMIVQQANVIWWDTNNPIMQESVQRVHAAYPVGIQDHESPWKAKKREWKDQFKSFLNTGKQMTKGEKLALTFLAVGLGIALIFGIGILSCNLSCSGAEGAAGAVAIFGVIGVVLLFVLFMKHLNKREKRT